MPTSRLTGRVKVLATGDHFFTWATSALMSSDEMPSHSMSTLTRTSVKPTGLSETSPVPQTVSSADESAV